MESKNNTNETIYKTETDRHRKQTYAYQREEGEKEGLIRSMRLIDTNSYA